MPELPEIDCDTLNRSGVLSEIAKLFPNQDHAFMLLSNIGYNTGTIPPFTVTPVIYWNNICNQIALGAIPDANPMRLIMEARNFYPANRILSRFIDDQMARIAHTPVTESPVQSIFPNQSLNVPVGPNLVITGNLERISVFDLANVIRGMNLVRQVQIAIVADNYYVLYFPDNSLVEAERVREQLNQRFRQQHPDIHFSLTEQFRDYYIHQLVIEGPDLSRFQVTDVAASTRVRDLADTVVEQYDNWSRDSHERLRSGVVDLVSQEDPDKRERLNPDATLHESGVWEGDVLQIAPESRAGGGTSNSNDQSPSFHSGDSPEPHLMRGGSGAEYLGRDYYDNGWSGKTVSKETYDPLLVQRRFLQAWLAHKVNLNDVIPLLVRIALHQSAEADRPSTELAPMSIPKQGTKVHIAVEHPGFLPISTSEKDVWVNADVDSEWAVFELRAVRPGKHRLQVFATLGNTLLGTMSLDVSVGEQFVTGSMVKAESSLANRYRQPGDVTMIVHVDAQMYRFQLIDNSMNIIEEDSSGPLIRGALESINSYLGNIDFILRNPPRNVYTRIAGVGMNLWKSLIPRKIRDYLLTEMAHIKRLFIYSTGDDAIPWEILVPHNPENSMKKHGFLIENFPISRWIFDKHPVQKFVLNPALWVTPQSGKPLLSVAAEIDGIRNKINSKMTLNDVIIEKFDDLMDAFGDKEFGLAHFACHNNFSEYLPSDKIHIKMGRSSFSPLELANYYGAFNDSPPLIFMNACRTDGKVPSLINLEGWATAFLKTGAGGFIGTHWSVDDKQAREFSEAFYAHLLEGYDVGEAMQQARLAIKNFTEYPTWLAYSYYGDAAAKVELG